MLIYQIRAGNKIWISLLTCAMVLSVSFLFMGCETEAKGGTAVGAGIGGLALAAAGGSTTSRLLLGATGALVGGAVGNQLVDKPAAEAKYKKDVQLAADQATASEYAKERARKDIEEQRLYDEWKRQRAATSSSAPSSSVAARIRAAGQQVS
jgi:hypothetical protein